MEFQVYILYSSSVNTFYVGYTENVSVRIEQHNAGKSNFTSKAKDWQLMYVESFCSREAAMKREMEIKNKKSRKYIEWLISTYK